MRALRRLLALLALAAAPAVVACEDTEGFLPATPQPLGSSKAPTCSGSPRSTIVTRLAFTRVSPEGFAPGFDLDQRTSDKSDVTSCGKQDFLDGEGRSGIDNQLAVLIPDVEKIVGNAVDGLIQGAINDGQLMILLDFEGIDDMHNDACLGVTVRLAQGKPTLGTDGVIEGFQTFTLKPGSSESRGDKGTIENGILSIGPMNVDIPLKIFDVSFILKVYDAHFRFRVDEDGFLDGYLGGGIIPEELIEGIKDGAGLDDIIPLVRTVLKTSSDLKPNADGKCTQLSVAVAMKAAPAFVQR